ncbi:hypothetical protein Pmani_009552 [Petrolisthes manimaculis]|uniref:Uncharacterized protein n=1 Tax=Petrolisthes manimaculis TaxID=1843537 RepID=A0AAE1Q412_9EUCA|nr:hypothetical protein Pmani_009552 [Petrolisthes manimaculis]
MKFPTVAGRRGIGQAAPPQPGGHRVTTPTTEVDNASCPGDVGAVGLTDQCPLEYSRGHCTDTLSREEATPAVDAITNAPANPHWSSAVPTYISYVSVQPCVEKSHHLACLYKSSLPV